MRDPVNVVSHAGLFDVCSRLTFRLQIRRGSSAHVESWIKVSVSQLKDSQVTAVQE